MPALPDIEQLGWIGAASHDLGDLIDIQTGVALTVLALAVGGIHGGGDLADLGALFGIRGRRKCETDLQQVELSNLIRWHGESVELLGLLGQTNSFIAGALAGRSGESLGVIGDEVFLDPGSPAGFDAEIVQLHFRGIEKFLGVGGGGLGLAATGQESEDGWNSETQDKRSHRGMITRRPVFISEARRSS